MGEKPACRIGNFLVGHINIQQISQSGYKALLVMEITAILTPEEKMRNISFVGRNQA